jgi:hypothetical protein
MADAANALCAILGIQNESRVAVENGRAVRSGYMMSRSGSPNDALSPTYMYVF